MQQIGGRAICSKNGQLVVPRHALQVRLARKESSPMPEDPMATIIGLMSTDFLRFVF